LPKKLVTFLILLNALPFRKYLVKMYRVKRINQFILKKVNPKGRKGLEIGVGKGRFAERLGIE